MNEDDVLAQLRDIHVPPELVAAIPIEFAAWPVIALAVVAGVILAARTWRRAQWRRHATNDLSRIARIEDRAAQWSLLLAFAGTLSGRAGHLVALPDLAYRHPATVTEAERAELIATLSAALRR